MLYDFKMLISLNVPLLISKIKKEKKFGKLWRRFSLKWFLTCLSTFLPVREMLTPSGDLLHFISCWSFLSLMILAAAKAMLRLEGGG